MIKQTHLIWLLAIGLLLLTSCQTLQTNIPAGTLTATDGNKIVAFQDYDQKTKGAVDKTTLIVVRIEGSDSESKMTKMMVEIKSIFNKDITGAE